LKKLLLNKLLESAKILSYDTRIQIQNTNTKRYIKLPR